MQVPRLTGKRATIKHMISWLGKMEAETSGFNGARMPGREVEQRNSSKKNSLYLFSHLMLEV
jgi:hypothetical protein